MEMQAASWQIYADDGKKAEYAASWGDPWAGAHVGVVPRPHNCDDVGGGPNEEFGLGVEGVVEGAEVNYGGDNHSLGGSLGNNYWKLVVRELPFLEFFLCFVKYRECTK